MADNKELLCPKCGAKLGRYYMKESCPSCGVNLFYYRFDERLEKDAELAQSEVDAVNRFVGVIKKSAVSSPLTIIRLVLFFMPLASMCLPMYNGLTLISLIIGIIKGTLDLGAVILPVVSMALVIVLSLAVIISSLFSAAKAGLIRNVVFSLINTAAFAAFGVIIGGIGVGWYLTAIIYVLELALHFACDKAIKKGEKNGQ